MGPNQTAKLNTANPRYLQALAFAVEAHGVVHQARKGTRFPYVVHVIRVADILERFHYGEDVVVAAFLHDTVEDAGVSYEELAAEFGGRVARLVEKASEPDKSQPWRARKQHTIDQIASEDNKDAHALALIAADKLDNALSIQETLRVEGEEQTWARFNRGRRDQHWYYRALAAALLEREPASALFRTLDAEVQSLFPDTRRTTHFFAGKPLGNPHDARAGLADPIKHWRPEYSAYELANAWLGTNEVPPGAHALLADAFGEFMIVEGLFEKQTKLDDLPRPSQTDLLLVLQTTRGLAVVGVEAKAREGFDDVVLRKRPNPKRLLLLCERLGLTIDEVQDIAYQLIHRTVATLLEAKRYGAAQAVMLVQSFDADDTSFDDFRRFAERLELSGASPGGLTSPRAFGGVTLRLGWAKER